MKKKLEKEIKKEILQHLNSLPDGFFFTVEQRPGMSRGCADILGCLSTGVNQGRFIAVEVKRPGEIPTPLQARFLDRIRSAGGIGIVARSVEDLEKEWL